jgi:hypothetical protein
LCHVQREAWVEVSTKSRPKFSQRKVDNNYAKHKTLVFRAQSTLARDLITGFFPAGRGLVLMGACFCSLFQWVFRYQAWNLFKNPWMYEFTLPSGLFSGLHWQFMNWAIQGISYLSTSQTLFPPIYFYFPTTFSLPVRKKRLWEILRILRFSEKEKCVASPPKWLFVSDFLGFLRSKNLAWWPTNFGFPKAPLT